MLFSDSRMLYKDKMINNLFSAIIPESQFNGHVFQLAQEQKLDGVKPFPLYPDGLIKRGHKTVCQCLLYMLCLIFPYLNLQMPTC